MRSIVVLGSVREHLRGSCFLSAIDRYQKTSLSKPAKARVPSFGKPMQLNYKKDQHDKELAMIMMIYILPTASHPNVSQSKGFPKSNFHMYFPHMIGLAGHIKSQLIQINIFELKLIAPIVRLTAHAVSFYTLWQVPSAGALRSADTRKCPETGRGDIYFAAFFRSSLGKMARGSKRRDKNHGNDDDGEADVCAINGVSQEWDGLPPIRDRLRDGGSILHPDTIAKQEDISQCLLNQELLMPLLSRMGALSKRTLPTMDDLREECYALLTLNKRTGEELVTMVEDAAYHIKKYCGFIKTKARRKEVSTVTWLSQAHI